MIRTSRVCAAGIYPILPGDTPTWLNLSGGPMVVPRDLKSREGEKEGFGIPVFRESGRLSWKGSMGMGKYAPNGLRLAKQANSGSNAFEFRTKNVRMKNIVIEIRGFRGFIGKIRHFTGLK